MNFPRLSRSLVVMLAVFSAVLRADRIDDAFVLVERDRRDDQRDQQQRDRAEEPDQGERGDAEGDATEESGHERCLSGVNQRP